MMTTILKHKNYFNNDDQLLRRQTLLAVLTSWKWDG